MSKNSDSDHSEDFINKSMNEYQNDASNLNDEGNVQKKKNGKKMYTKDDALDQMKDLNSKLRGKLKDLNGRLERILDSIKYKLLASEKIAGKGKLLSDVHSKQGHGGNESDAKKSIIESNQMEIEVIRKQIAINQTELESLHNKLQEAGEYDRIFEVKKLIENEKKNQEILKKTIRDLK